MRNIHIFETDRPTRLLWYTYGEFGLSKKHLLWKEGRNIYITNDEQVNRYDYYINNNECIQAMLVPVTSKCKKIILTTDRDLIENGVQSIDDEFLEWFINNPNCEEVGVDKNWNYPLDKSWEYKIIIPKEEHKQDPLEEAAKEYAEMHLDVSGNLGKYLIKAVFQDGAQWQQERMYSEEDMAESFIACWKANVSEGMECKLSFKEWFEQFKKL